MILENSASLYNDPLYTIEELLGSSPDRKAKVRKRHFVFPETFNNCDDLSDAAYSNTPQFTPIADQEQQSANNVGRRAQLSINMEAIPSPTFGPNRAFATSPTFECEHADRREILPSPISAWLLSPLAARLHNFPNTPSVTGE
eukprot:TRINITY_DN4180_c0_g1_i2.p1 TRINITY_DN4180_c0_g1~~TRINITY_DN4180_c0_g1_i2.p1  ORF type:complete len:143 (+),score=10.23 TRINITY_DN4180_c0_g1_i2:747-1175(+)